MEKIKDKLYDLIVKKTRTNVGVKTTEIGIISEELNVSRQDVSVAIYKLQEDGRIKFCTEKFKKVEGKWKGDYCWIVPNKTNVRFIGGVKKIECEPFGIHPKPNK